MKLFFSYKYVDEDFVDLVFDKLRNQQMEIFYWKEKGRAGRITRELTAQIDSSDALIVFVGSEWGETQEKEVQDFAKTYPERPLIPVILADPIPRAASFLTGNNVSIPAGGNDSACAGNVAKRIVELLGWKPDGGLPKRYIVANEKVFLDDYRAKKPELMDELRCECGWTDWPKVEKKDAPHPNPINDRSIGTLSDDSEMILLDARRRAGSIESDALMLPEARPRLMLRYPQEREGELGVGVLVSGGIAPGINAVIDGIVSRHFLYLERQKASGLDYELKILGYREGFKSLLRSGVQTKSLTAEKMRGVVESGGSCLGTSRADELLLSAENRELNLKKAIGKLQNDEISILYVVGGDGSMSCAHALWNYANRAGYDLSVVCVPKAMDNDILWVWQSFGFLSSVEEARQAILHMHTEVSSNPRVGIVQLFGSDSGFIASHAGYSTACDLVLIPEDPMSMDEIFTHIQRKLRGRFQDGLKPVDPNTPEPYALVVMAETALPTDAEKYCGDERVGLSVDEQKAVENFVKQGRRLRGQTPDHLRRAGLKIVSSILQDRIRKEMRPVDYWKDFRVITNEPRHLIRSIPPSVTDVIFGERLGALAVDNAMAGYTDFMVSQWLTEFVLVPLKLVVLGRKRVPIDGIFWKSVLSKTGQKSRAKAGPPATP